MIEALLALTTWKFVTYVDPMDDTRTYVAQIGRQGGELLEVQCGSATGGKLMVGVSTGKRLYVSDMPRVSNYSERVRFDDRPAITVRFHYIDDQALASGKEAELFLAEMATARRVQVELSNHRNESVIVSFPVAGATEPVTKVRNACFGPRSTK